MAGYAYKKFTGCVIVEFEEDGYIRIGKKSKVLLLARLMMVDVMMKGLSGGLNKMPTTDFCGRWDLQENLWWLIVAYLLARPGRPLRYVPSSHFSAS